MTFEAIDKVPAGDWRLREEETDENDDISEIFGTPDAHGAPHAFVGQLRAMEPDGTYLEISPPADDEVELQPPTQGYLFVSLRGDSKRITRRIRAERDIRLAHCPMLNLGLLLENQRVPVERSAPHRRKVPPSVQNIIGRTPTPRQKEALRIAMNTPDIALIQGPPGTGKTQVIAALCAWLADHSESKNEVSGQTLITSYQHDAVENAAAKTTVYGLPAVKVGRRRKHIGTGSDATEAWRKEIIAKLEASPDITPGLGGLQRRLAQEVASYSLAPGSPQQTSALLDRIIGILTGEIDGKWIDLLRERRDHLSGNIGSADAVDRSGNNRLIMAVRSLRSDAASFGDDGPANAYKVLKRLEPYAILRPAERQIVERAAAWTSTQCPPFLPELETTRHRLLEALAVSGQPAQLSDADPETQQLLLRLVDVVDAKVRSTRVSVADVLNEYLDDLKTDPTGARSALLEYTAVLAATCQQSVAFEMVAVKTEQKEDSRLAFDTVIIDEAARANPLDLFIPMSLAKRKIILVGDHRQLPHSLEPDVERELDRNLSKETAEIFRTSLFERLFRQMRRFEKEDGISRTVTLDTQFRMHPILGQFVSETFYEHHGDPKIEAGRGAGEFAHGIAPYSPAVAAWVDIPIGLGAERGKTSKCRPQEADWIADELQRLISLTTDCSFGVITFYSEQERELWRALAARGLAEEGEDGGYRPSARCQPFVSPDGRFVEPLRVGTVDAFQGKEFDVVFLSMTRSNTIPADEAHSRRKYGHLMLENRLCVAMSRQKRLLVVVGDSTMLRASNAEASIRSLVAFRSLCEGTNGICL